MFQHHESTPIFPAASDAMARAVVPTQYATAHGEHQRRLVLLAMRLGAALFVAVMLLAAWLIGSSEDGALASDAPYLVGLSVGFFVCVGLVSVSMRPDMGLYVTADEVQVQGVIRRYSVPRSPSGESVLKLRSKAGGHTVRLRGKGPVIQGILHLAPRAQIATGYFTRFPKVNHLLVRTGDGEWRQTGKVFTDENVAELTAWLSSPAAAGFRPTA